MGTSKSSKMTNTKTASRGLNKGLKNNKTGLRHLLKKLYEGTLTNEEMY